MLDSNTITQVAVNSFEEGTSKGLDSHISIALSPRLLTVNHPYPWRTTDNKYLIGSQYLISDKNTFTLGETRI